MKNGLTIIETLVGLFVAVITSLLIYNIYSFHFKIYANQRAFIEADVQNKIALTAIRNYMREGIRFSNEVQWKDVPGGGSGQPQEWILGIVMLPLDQNGDPWDPGDYDHVFIQRDPNALNKLILYGSTPQGAQSTREIVKRGDPESYQNDGLLPPKIIATNVKDFKVSYDTAPADYISATKVNITITTEEKTTFGKKFENSQTATFYFKQ